MLADAVSKSATDIPTFFLYGEPLRDVGDRFLHVENLDTRCRPSNWRIRRHAHAQLHHAILVAEGGGTAEHDGREIAFTAPCVLLTPARCIHGFRFDRDTDGWVTTVSAVYLDDLARRDRIAAAVFTQARVAALEPETAQRLRGVIERLERELAWRAPGHDLMVDALFASLLVDLARSSAPEGGERGASLNDAELVARFRNHLEGVYRRRRSVGEMVRALGVSETRLRTACRNAAGAAPLKIINDRVMAEARRMLLYSSMTVAETAEALGFDDPAYFSRLFAQTVGVSPRAYRAAWRRGPSSESAEPKSSRA